MATCATRREQTARNRKPHSAAGRNHRRGLFLERLENRELLALVSHWSGDNTVLDSVGNNHGTLTSGATYAAGQVGQAFKLDGVNDRVQVADSPSLALTNSLTIEGWIRTDTQPTAQHGNIFFRGDDRGGLDPYWLSLEPTGQLVFQVESLTAASGIVAPLPIGRFVHVAATLDDASGVMRLYLDGELKAEQITAVRPFGNLDAGSNPGIGIGNHGGYPSTPHNFPFNGLIDELKIYDNALTAAEVQASYLAGGGQIQISIGDAQAAEGVPAFLGEPLVPPNGSGLASARTLLMGPDGNVYVASFDTDSVKIFADGTGEYLGELTTPGGELDAPIGMTFGPDGKLYVGGRFSQNVVRFDIRLYTRRAARAGKSRIDGRRRTQSGGANPDRLE